METVTHTELFEEYNKCWTGVIMVNNVTNCCTFGQKQCTITDENRLFILPKFKTMLKHNNEMWLWYIFSNLTQSSSLHGPIDGSIYMHTRKFIWQEKQFF